MGHPLETLREIGRRVLSPGVRGEALEIARPFGRRRAESAAGALRADGESTNIAEVHALIRGDHSDDLEGHVVRRMRRLTPIDPATADPRIDGAIVRLAALFHDAIAASHPSIMARWGGRLIEATIAALDEIAPPATLREALVRHAWLGALPLHRCVRTDVRWWSGRATFVGRRPPRRLFAWPDARRVRRADLSVDLLRLPELFVDRDAGDRADLHARAMRAFLVATPITDLVLSAREAPAFVWTRGIAVLVSTDTGVRVARRAIALSADGGRVALDVLARSRG